MKKRTLARIYWLAKERLDNSFFFACLILTVLFLTVPGTLWAELKTPPAFLQTIDRNSYPFAHSVLAQEIEHIEFQADGSRISSDDVYLTVLDEEGKQNHKVLSFQVNKAYGWLKIEACEIIRGQKITSVDIAAQSREEALSSASQSNIYNPQQKIVKLFLPGLKIGDTIHYHLTSRQFKPIIENQIYGSILGQYDIPIYSYIFTLTTPTSSRLDWLIKDEIKGAVTYRKTDLPGKSAKTIRSWHFYKVPQIVPEPNMPSFRRVAMRLLYSTLPDWQAVSGWYDGLVAKKLAPGDELKQKVLELTGNISGRDKKIATLFYYVARKIRYLGVSGESERPGFEPHDVNLTFSRRHGVCRDKAALLVSMLQIAGFRARAVLLRVGDKLDREIPLPYFNHAIVAVLDKNGNVTEFLDPTSETSRQFLPDYERECSFLVADKQRSDLGLTPPLAPESNGFTMDVKDKLSPDGTLSGTLRVNCTGFNDTLMRSIMMNKSEKEQKLLLERFFLTQYSTLELTDVKWSDPADRRVNFNFSGNFSLVSAAVSGRDRLAVCFQPLSSMADLSLLERWILSRVDMVKRHYPLKLGYTFSTSVTEELTFVGRPEKVQFPPKIELENEIFSASFVCRQPSPAGLLLERQFVMKKTEVAPEIYSNLTNLQNRKLRLSLTPVEVVW